MNVTPNSHKKVWWKCSKGHEWQAVVASRNRGSGCPYCSGRKAISGINDLETLSSSDDVYLGKKNDNGVNFFI